VLGLLALAVAASRAGGTIGDVGVPLPSLLTGTVPGFSVAGVFAPLLGAPLGAGGLGFGLLIGGVVLLLAGGVLVRLARGHPIGASSFLSACRTHVLRLFRLAVLMLPPYAALVLIWPPRLLPGRALVQADFLLGLFAVLLVNLVADYAAVRTVVEDRRSAVGSVAASVRFLGRRFWGSLGLYVLNLLAMIALLVVSSQLARSAPSAGVPTTLAPLVVVLLVIWARLALLASEIAFFQRELGSLTAAPPSEPVWPDAPGD
jgi:hypothetical protein